MIHIESCDFSCCYGNHNSGSSHYGSRCDKSLRLYSRYLIVTDKLRFAPNVRSWFFWVPIQSLLLHINKIKFYLLQNDAKGAPPYCGYISGAIFSQSFYDRAITEDELALAYQGNRMSHEPRHVPTHHLILCMSKREFRQILHVIT